MSERIIKLEASSLEEARRGVKTDEVILLDEFILCHGKVETIEAVGDTVEEAFIKAQSKVPAGAKTERKIKVAPKRITLQAQGDDEESVGKEKAKVIASVSLLKKGRKGLWGFGRTSNVYEVVISQQAVVELRFQEQAALLIKVRGYLAEDLFQVIQEIRRRNAPWTEILQLLNPKNDPEIQESLIKLYELNPLSVLDTIEDVIKDVCRKNEKANWQKVIKKAYERAAAEIEAEKKRQEEAEMEAQRQARVKQERELAEKKRKEEALKEAQRQAALERERRLREQAVKLRKLDVEIAKVFMFYTSIDWYEKDYARSGKEPTGLPRTGYGKEHLPSPTLRMTIPHYSTDKEAFGKLEARIKGWNLYDPYLQCLTEEGYDETTATLEQKCVASLKVKRSS
jgi:hypothetical protein